MMHYLKTCRFCPVASIDVPPTEGDPRGEVSDPAAGSKPVKPACNKSQQRKKAKDGTPHCDSSIRIPCAMRLHASFPADDFCTLNSSSCSFALLFSEDILRHRGHRNDTSISRTYEGSTSCRICPWPLGGHPGWLERHRLPCAIAPPFLDLRMMSGLGKPLSLRLRRPPLLSTSCTGDPLLVCVSFIIFLVWPE